MLSESVGHIFWQDLARKICLGHSGHLKLKLEGYEMELSQNMLIYNTRAYSWEDSKSWDQRPWTIVVYGSPICAFSEMEASQYLDFWHEAQTQHVFFPKSERSVWSSMHLWPNFTSDLASFSSSLLEWIVSSFLFNRSKWRHHLLMGRVSCTFLEDHVLMVHLGKWNLSQFKKYFIFWTS
jgi:hypothetical protein